MRNTIVLIAFVLSVFSGFSQGTISYYDGTPVLEKKRTDVEGTELLYPDWTVGTVTTKEGKTYRGIKLKYNLLEDRLYFLADNGVTMLFNTPVASFTIGDSASMSKAKTFRNGFPATGNLKADAYFEVLASGKITLLKKTGKSIMETKEYNSPVVKKEIMDNVQYFIFSDNMLTPVKKDQSFIVQILKEKIPGIETYLKSTKLNLKKEEDLISLVAYSNTL
jgi:hypothetical protein